MPSKPFVLSVSALIHNDKGSVLLVKRSQESTFFPGQWEAPGGKIDPGEAFDAALLREIAEETALEVIIDGFAGTTEFELPHVNVILLYMNAHVVAGEMRLSEEHEDFAWLPESEFKTKELSPKFANFLRDCR